MARNSEQLREMAAQATRLAGTCETSEAEAALLETAVELNEAADKKDREQERRPNVPEADRRSALNFAGDSGVHS